MRASFHSSTWTTDDATAQDAPQRNALIVRREKSPAFQLYPKDFLTDERVQLMSYTERGIYITLLSLCWLETSLPWEPTRIAQLLHMKPSRFAKWWQNGLSLCFVPREDGRLVNPRLESERLKQEQFRSRQSEKGKASAVARKSNAVQPRFNRGATGRQPPLVQPNGNSSSSSSTPVQSVKEQHSGVRPFLTWFQAEYKARRQGAEYLVKWAKHGTLVKQMLGATDLEHLKIYAQILLSEKTDDDFISGTDRGIEVLSARFSWLSDRYAAWKARHVS